MRNLGRILAVLIVLAIAAFLLFMCSVNDIPDPVAEPATVEEIAEPESLPEPVIAPEPVIEPEPAPEPEVVALDPASCTFPGDGFTPHPHGFRPEPGQYVDYDQPSLISGLDTTDRRGVAMPESYTGSGDSACVVVTYDIGADGVPLNAQVYDSALASGADPATFEDLALYYVGEMRYTPAERNGKPVRIDDNTDEIRFEALEE
ncbi:energy transducer TonB [Aquisalinus flavus]|uniref:TonB C-terminal domain-containing protein n=1 Tax=Aquisalinus flavus TaxID=1526572 RepID=A0A8J2V6P2_9PROT|nr:energy transducer TonB [Aquisalinus flavus]MBD0426468.1 energy transducer TonB [Aquisalinus flavus]UNE47978.1 hypothetical protein FF099_07920 [Aquisalinus flavus]GGD07690.1 hypothetical protein GCM10011342_15680 [Aquisalinus flavus]